MSSIEILYMSWSRSKSIMLLIFIHNITITYNVEKYLFTSKITYNIPYLKCEHCAFTAIKFQEALTVWSGQYTNMLALMHKTTYKITKIPVSNWLVKPQFLYH
jgi:hypothetical protein